MTTQQTKKPEANAPITLPGPPLLATNYSMVQPKSRLTELIAKGRNFTNGEGHSGIIEAITNMGGGTLRVTVKSGESCFYVDLAGDWFGNVAEHGARSHQPIVVRPEVAEARRALLNLDAKARAEALEGFAPSAA